MDKAPDVVKSPSHLADLQLKLNILTFLTPAQAKKSQAASSGLPLMDGSLNKIAGMIHAVYANHSGRISFVHDVLDNIRGIEKNSGGLKVLTSYVATKALYLKYATKEMSGGKGAPFWGTANFGINMGHERVSDIKKFLKNQAQLVDHRVCRKLTQDPKANFDLLSRVCRRETRLETSIRILHRLNQVGQLVSFYHQNVENRFDKPVLKTGVDFAFSSGRAYVLGKISTGLAGLIVGSLGVPIISVPAVAVYLGVGFLVDETERKFIDSQSCIDQFFAKDQFSREQAKFAQAIDREIRRLVPEIEKESKRIFVSAVTPSYSSSNEIAQSSLSSTMLSWPTQSKEMMDVWRDQLVQSSAEKMPVDSGMPPLSVLVSPPPIVQYHLDAIQASSKNRTPVSTRFTVDGTWSQGLRFGVETTNPVIGCLMIGLHLLNAQIEKNRLTPVQQSLIRVDEALSQYTNRHRSWSALFKSKKQVQDEASTHLEKACVHAGEVLQATSGSGEPLNSVRALELAVKANKIPVDHSGKVDAVKLTQIQQDYSEKTIQKVQKYLDQGAISSADRAVKDLVYFDPENPLAWQVSAIVSEKKGEYKKADASLKKASERIQDQVKAVEAEQNKDFARRHDPGVKDRYAQREEQLVELKAYQQQLNRYGYNCKINRILSRDSISAEQMQTLLNITQEKLKVCGSSDQESLRDRLKALMLSNHLDEAEKIQAKLVCLTHEDPMEILEHARILQELGRDQQCQKVLTQISGSESKKRLLIEKTKTKVARAKEIMTKNGNPDQSQVDVYIACAKEHLYALELGACYAEAADIQLELINQGYLANQGDDRRHLANLLLLSGQESAAISLMDQTIKAGDYSDEKDVEHLLSIYYSQGKLHEYESCLVEAFSKNNSNKKYFNALVDHYRSREKPLSLAKLLREMKQREGLSSELNDELRRLTSERYGNNVADATMIGVNLATTFFYGRDLGISLAKWWHGDAGANPSPQNKGSIRP